MRRALTAIVIMACVLFGCRTVYEGPVVRMRADTGGNPKGVIAVSQEKEDTLRSSNYRYVAVLPKAELDRVMAAMEQYHLEIFKALKPPVEKLPGYTDVVIPENEASFRKTVGAFPEAIVDPDFVAVIPSKRTLVVLHRGTWPKFSRRLFRAQARLFFSDYMPKLPPWLREGMVSFFEEAAVGGLGAETSFKIVGYSAEKMAGVHALMEQASGPDMLSLSAAMSRENLSEADRLAAWAFVFWSQHSGSKSRATFKRYLSAIIEKGFENTDIEDYLQMSVADFEKRWKEWLLRQEVYVDKKP